MNKSNWDSYWGVEKELEYWRKPAKSEGLKLISLKKKEHYWDNKGKKQFCSYWEAITKKE